MHVTSHLCRSYAHQNLFLGLTSRQFCQEQGGHGTSCHHLVVVWEYASGLRAITSLYAGKLSGQAAVTSRLKGLGYTLTKEQMADIFVRFKVSQDHCFSCTV